MKTNLAVENVLTKNAKPNFQYLHDAAINFAIYCQIKVRNLEEKFIVNVFFTEMTKRYVLRDVNCANNFFANFVEYFVFSFTFLRTILYVQSNLTKFEHR